MDRLLPTFGRDLTDDDLVSAYAYPAGRAWLRANMVAAADGAAVLKGRSGGLSSPGDKRVFALLRDLCDVILVGAATVRAEGYSAVRRSEARVEWRRSQGLTDVPAIAVLSGKLDLDPNATLFTKARVPTLVITTEQAAAAHPQFASVADLIVTEADRTFGRLDVGVAVDALVSRGFRRILCEGGPKLLAQIASAGRLDELCLTVSPLLTSGDAPRVVNGHPIDPAISLEIAHLLVEDDLLFLRYRTRH